MDIIVKSYKDIHGTFPTDYQALPADGLWFFLSKPTEEDVPKCTCNACEDQRMMRKNYTNEYQEALANYTRGRYHPKVTSPSYEIKHKESFGIVNDGSFVPDKEIEQ